MYIYYLSISVGQESGHKLAGSSVSKFLANLQSKCQPGFQSHLKAQLGEIYFKSDSHGFEEDSLFGCWTEDLNCL